MRLRITAKHTELTDSLKSFAEEKADRLLKFFDRSAHAQLILSPDFVGRRKAEGLKEEDVAEPDGRPDDSAAPSGHVATAELIMSLPGEKKPLVAHARGENYRASIDMVLDKMERQLAKHKEKRKDHRHRGPSEAQ